MFGTAMPTRALPDGSSVAGNMTDPCGSTSNTACAPGGDRAVHEQRRVAVVMRPLCSPCTGRVYPWLLATRRRDARPERFRTSD